MAKPQKQLNAAHESAGVVPQLVAFVDCNLQQSHVYGNRRAGALVQRWDVFGPVG